MAVIGIDHGNAAMKTSHFSFPSGVVEYEHEPYTQKDVLEYGGRYYVCGTGRQPLLRDKTVNDSFYHLTLAAIAKEMAVRCIESKATLTLAVGLPLTSFGRDKRRFERYLLRDETPVSFTYEGKPYDVDISKVYVFPQGYAAALLHMDMLAGEQSVIVTDIGGWTVDVMRLDRYVPNAATCRSLELGMIRCIDEIAEQIRRNLGLSLTEVQIESALRGESSTMHGKAKEMVLREGRKYVQKLISAITECGLDVHAMPVIFMGGGSDLMQRHVTPLVEAKSAPFAPSQAQARNRSLASPLSHESTSASQTTTFAGALNNLCRPIILSDVCANAKGYEALVRRLSAGSGHAG